MPRATLATAPFTIDPHRPYSLAEWQTIEEITGERYEYHQGKLVSVRAMAGGPGPHALIGGNVMYMLGALVRAKSTPSKQANGNGRRESCGVYSSDLRLMIEAEERYVYSDAAVVCGRPQYDATITTAVTNPVAVVEVMSPQSGPFDSGDKFDYYATLASLRDYVLVAQDRPRVEVRSRSQSGADWTIHIAEGLEAAAPLSALSDGLPLAEVYRLVEFE